MTGHKPGCPAPAASLVEFKHFAYGTSINCRLCGASWPKSPPSHDPEPQGRYVLLCVDCGIEIRTSKPKARIPLCDRHRMRRKSRNAS